MNMCAGKYKHSPKSATNAKPFRKCTEQVVRMIWLVSRILVTATILLLVKFFKNVGRYTAVTLSHKLKYLL